MKPLTYSEYINDVGVIEALRVPPEPPAGQTAATWPIWHRPGESGPGVEWSPGQPWPTGGNWCHDEVLFIRTHQAFEVWFALILHELDSVLAGMNAVCAARGSTLAMVALDERKEEAAAHRPEDFPRLARQAAMCSREDMRSRVARIAAPGRHRVETDLRVAWLDVPALMLWSSRVERATAALHSTIPFFDVLSTLTPAQFLRFRGRLVPASGFGSVQFRELELVAGLRELNRAKIQPVGGTPAAETGGPVLPAGMWRPTEKTPPAVDANSYYRAQPATAWGRVARRYASASLRDAVYALLNSDVLWESEAAERAATDAFAAKNVEETVRDWQQSAARPGDGVGAESLLSERIEELDKALSHRENIAAALLAMREPIDPIRAAVVRLLDACLRLDGALLAWRDRHIRFVESIIGARRGTGGGGVQYLRGTTKASRGMYLTHAFPCLWEARSLVQKAD